MSQNISTILNSRISLVVISVNIVISVLFFMFSVQFAEREFQKNIELQTRHLADTFTQQLWLFDLNTTEQLAALALDTPEINGLRLLDDNRRILVEKGHFASEAATFIEQQLIHKSGATVGYLELEFTNAKQEQQRNTILQISIVAVVITVLLTFLLISQLLNIYLVHPLQVLQKDMVQVADGRFEASSLSGQALEIQTIINGFNQMAISLAQREEEREKAELQQKKLEGELRQKYKMEAVGMMAGGIAHNFNNNLAIILGNLELAQMKSDADPKLADHFKDATIAICRARDLTKQILAYSRQDDHELSPVQPALIIDETLKLMRSTIPTTVTLDCRFSKEMSAVTIMADSTRIQEAMINLCNNAVQAMDESGTLSIRLSLVALAQSDIPVRYNCLPGNYACLSVQDTGYGMSAEIVEKIFDPFFTTKGVDQGTGMGLSTVHGIVEQHGGLIKVQSIEGQGALFELFFPVVESAQVQEFSAVQADLPLGTERILFVDDEQMLASLGESMLSDLGYRVTVESNSVAALARFRSNPDNFDLLITDQTMPELTGLELSQQVRTIRPEFPIILCTGYSSKTSQEEVEKSAVTAFCMKPLERSALATVVRRVLDDR